MKLSIITINYNNLEGLKRTYESVVCQTWTDYEWIVIDGGSTDGSREFIEEHQDKFAYWCSEPDKGVYNAMNKGIAMARGEYFNFMNSGDCFYEAQTLENVFREPLTGDLIYGDWIRIYSDHEEFKEAPKDGFHAIVFFENVCHQAMFIKSEILKSKGYDENLKIYADWKRWMDMSLDGQTFQKVPFTICMFEAEKGLSATEFIIRNEEILQLYDYLPREIGLKMREYHELRMKEWEYQHNPLISEIIRITVHGPSYKTKLIHLGMVIINMIEKVFG